MKTVPSVEQLEGRCLLATLLVGEGYYETIQTAIDAAQPGDTVSVAPGIYSERVNVYKPLILIGPGAGIEAWEYTGDQVVLNGIDVGNGRSTALTISASGVTVDGFTFTDATSPNVFGAAVYLVPGTHGTTFANNIVQNSIVGMFVANDDGTQPTLVTGNLFRNNTQPGPASGHDIYADQYTAGSGLDGLIVDGNHFDNTEPPVFGAIGPHALGLSNTADNPHMNVVFTNNYINNHGLKPWYRYNVEPFTESGNTVIGPSLWNTTSVTTTIQSFTDIDGDVYTVKLKGPGSLTVNQYDPDNTNRGPIGSIDVVGSTVKTKLIIRVTFAQGDGVVTVGDLNAGAMGVVSAPKCVFTGVIRIDSLTALQLDGIASGAVLEVANSLKTFRANWVGQAIVTAQTVNSFTVRGNCLADLHIGNLGMGRINGNLGGTWQIAGDVRLLAVLGFVTDWDNQILGTVYRKRGW